MTATDEQIIDALAGVCERQRDASPLAVWSELHDREQIGVADLRALERRLSKLARERKLARHRREGDRRTFYRPASKPLPLFCRPVR